MNAEVKPYRVTLYPADHPAAGHAIAFERRYQHGTLAGLDGVPATLVVVYSRPDTIVAVARLIFGPESRVGSAADDFGLAVDPRGWHAGWAEMGSFAVHPRFQVHTAPHLLLWQAVVQTALSMCRDLVALLDVSQVGTLQMIHHEPWGQNGGCQPWGLSSMAGIFGVDLLDYATRLEVAHPDSHALFFKGEGLEAIAEYPKSWAEPTRA